MQVQKQTKATAVVGNRVYTTNKASREHTNAPGESRTSDRRLAHQGHSNRPVTVGAIARLLHGPVVTQPAEWVLFDGRQTQLF